MTPLTPRQYQVLSFIIHYQKNAGYVPSLYEICSTLTMPKNTARRFLEVLKKKGYIRQVPKRSYVLLVK